MIFFGYNKGNFRINKVNCMNFDSKSLYYSYHETQKDFWLKKKKNLHHSLQGNQQTRKNDKCYCIIHETQIHHF